MKPHDFSVWAAPALKAFPTLRNFWNFKPRNTFSPAFSGSPSKLQRATLEQNLKSIYHDLGALAWKGGKVKDMQRLGGILQTIIDAGGPGRLRPMVAHEYAQCSHTEFLRLPDFKSSDLFSIENTYSYTGSIEPIPLMKIADEIFREQIRNHLAERAQEKGIPMENVFFKVDSVDLHPKSFRRSIRSPLPTSNPPSKILPVYAYVGIIENPNIGTLHLNMRLCLGGGLGTQVGRVNMKYTIHELYGQGRARTINLCKPRQPDNPQATSQEAAISLVQAAVDDLYSLELDVYGDTLENLAQKAA